MVYLESFIPYLEDRAVYPYKVIYQMLCEVIDFAPITILYGNNGCGKSTLLNVIAECIGINKKTPGNANEYFDSYVGKCRYVKRHQLPDDCALIRSEDIMWDISSTRKQYKEAVKKMANKKQAARDYGIKDDVFNSFCNNPDNLASEERYMIGNIRELQSYRTSTSYITDKMASNGEIALEYFKEHVYGDNLYLLDEPENSMAPTFQKELARIIALFAYRLDSQFVIATHSPFMLSIEGAKIYDLDSHPVSVKPWYQLQNMQEYNNLFRKFGKYFNKD